MNYCSNCGSPVIKNANFCAECGEKIVKAETTNNNKINNENFEKFITLMIRKTLNSVGNSRTEDELFEDRASSLIELKKENKHISEEEIAERAILNTFKECQNQILNNLNQDKITQICDALECDIAQINDVLEHNNKTTPNFNKISEFIENMIELAAKKVKKALKAKYFINMPEEVIKEFNILELKEIKYNIMSCLDLLLEFEIINTNQNPFIGNSLEVTIKINNKTNFNFSKVYFNCVFFDENGKTIDVQKDWTYDQIKKTEQFGKLSFLGIPENATHYKIEICDIRFR